MPDNPHEASQGFMLSELGVLPEGQNLTKKMTKLSKICAIANDSIILALKQHLDMLNYVNLINTWVNDYLIVN